ncbi:hypothetical protein [Chryseobacterium sp. IT-36CA2]|uniref:hypothetical protein n=1 Tax=Chryseobacterium sp. IT-36CA2 TaxID=3026460 RepID=UPI0039E17F21
MTKQKKVFQRFTTVCLALVGLLAVLTSCKGNDDDVQREITHKWYYKVEASSGSTINNIIYPNHYEPMSPNVSLTSINGTTWKSPEFERKTWIWSSGKGGEGLFTAIKAKATGVDASSTLKVQIYVNDILVKEMKDVGQTLTAEANYQR